MTLPVIDLRGQGSIGESIAQIGAAAANIIRPFEQEKQEFNNFLATTPGAAERLAEQERLNPGFLKSTFSFLPDDQIAQIIATPQTAAQTAEQFAREGLEKAPKELIAGLRALAASQAVGGPGVTPAEAVLVPSEQEAAIGIVKDEPEVIAEAVREGIVGRPRGAQAMDELRAELTQSVLEVVEDLPIEEAEKLALREIAPGFFFEQDRLIEHQNRLAIAQITSAASSGEVGRRAQVARREAQGVRMFNDTNIQSPEAWTEFLYAEQSATFRGLTPLERGRELAGQNLTEAQVQSGLLSGTISQDELDAMEMAQAIERRENIGKSLEIASERRVVADLINRITERDRDTNPILTRSVRLALLEQLNDAYRFLNNISGGSIPIRVGEIPPGIFRNIPLIGGPGNTPLIIRNDSGEMLDSSDPLESIDPSNLQGQDPGAAPGAEPSIPPAVQRQNLEEASRLRGVIEESQRQAEAPQAERVSEGAKQIPDSMINFQQIDQSLLTPNGVANVQTIIDGRGTFLEMAEENPAAALEMLKGFRIQSPQVVQLIRTLEGRIPEEELNQ